MHEKSPEKNVPKASLLKLSERPLIALDALEKQVLGTMGLADSWSATMIERSRRSAIVPKVSLDLDFDHDVGVRRKAIINPDNTTLKQSAQGFGLGLSATFDLSELIFHKSELEIASLALKRLEKREKLIERLHALYFSYKELQESGLKPKEAQEITKIKIELERIAAALDSLSNNAFSRFLEPEKL